MEETPQRLDRVSKLEELGAEVEVLFARGLAPVPLVIADKVDPVVRLLRSGNNVALVGPSSSGRRSIAYGLRRSDVWGEDPQLTLELSASGAHPNSWPVYRTTARHWMDGVLYAGNLENKINGICRRVTTDSIVLFEAIHTAIGVWQGRGESLDLVDLLVDVAAHPKIHMVVTTTSEGWARLTESKPDFVSRFVVVDVAPPDKTESRMIVTFALSDPTSRNGRFADAAVDEAFRLAARYFPSESPLGPTMRILRSATSSARGRVDDESILQACARELGLQRRWIGISQLPTASAIVADLELTVVGQRRACAALADDLIAAAQGLTPPGRPRSYLLAGTPGVGKTSLACAVQRMLGGGDSEPLRFDCSEYSASSLEVMRLLANEPGSLTTGLMRRPGAVVLLDEIDRLHPAARDLLYQMLGEGRLTTLEGETVSCANAVVFMTTNAGSGPWLRTTMDESQVTKASAATRRACIEMLGPAIASRVTRILVFPPLELEHTVSIVQTELERIAAVPSLKERGIVLEATSELVRAIAHHGLSSTNGARGLHKVIHESVAIPVARYLSEQPSASGRLLVDAIRVDGVLEGVRIRSQGERAQDRKPAAMPGYKAGAECQPGPMMWN
jgi:ATP-dependent Clp protease ATP-binding subunit ClpC